MKYANTTNALSISLLSIALAFLALSWPAGSLAQEGAPRQEAPAQDPSQPTQPERPARGQGRERPPSVERSMKSMERAIDQLHEQLSDAAKKDENLKLINDMQAACVAVKGMPIPEKVLRAAADDAARAAIIAAYRADLIKVLKTCIELEEAVIDGKTDAARASLDLLDTMRDEAHERLGVEEEEKR